MFEGGSAGKVVAGGGDRSAARRPYWLIRRPMGGYIEALTVEFGDVEALPVFSFEEEAELFLSLGVSGGGWEVRRSGAGEILSFLHGPLSGVHGVALDPLPECCGGPLLELLTIEKEDFEAMILGVNPILSFFSKTSLPA